MAEALNDRRVVQLLDSLSKTLDPEDRVLLKDLVALAGGDPEKLLNLLGDLAALEYRWNPVDVETFLHHKDYLDLKGQIFPQLVDDIVELFEDPLGYQEANICGGIGFGKSTLAELALSRMVYETSCLTNPQKAFGLMDGSTIAFLNASVNLKQAEKVVFQGLKTKLRRSPYFQEVFPFDADLKKEMRFPGNLLIMPVAGSEGGTVGYSVLGGVLDEVNFWAVVASSSQARGSTYDQARHVYDMLIRRIKSRFSKQGKMPGILLTVSSSKYPNDFTEVRIKEVEEALRRHDANPAENPHPKTLMRRYSTWSTKPRSDFLPEAFWCYLGTSNEQPAISKEHETFKDKPEDRVIEVPMDFWNDFSTDILGAIRDLAGYPTLAIKPFFTQKDKITEAMERGRRAGQRHPYSVITTTLEDGAYFDTDLLKFDQTKWYFAHVDLAIKKDKAGIGIAHIAGWKTITRRNLKTGVLITSREPDIVVDFMLQVQAPEGGEIQVDFVRGLLLELRQYGCNFKKITYDQYQSVSSIQAFQRMGIESEKMSVDAPLDAYNAFKEAFLEDRIRMYPYQPLIEELVRLELKEKGSKSKVDHPPKGSKDVADGVCGAVYLCELHKLTAQVDPSYGESEDAMTPDTFSGTHLARGLQPTMDEAGNLLPGKKVRRVEDLIWRTIPGYEGDEEEEDDGYGIGFA